MKKLLFTAVICSLIIPPLRAFQSPTGAVDSPGKRTVIPGPEYDAGWLHRVLFGSNWRNLWTTPIQVEVLDLAHFANGLTPLKKGGGKQTTSLRLVGGDGKEYKFRSIDKDARKALPQDLQESIAGDFLQDQISSQNPMSVLIASPLLHVVGVLNEEPRVVMMPDDERLGDYRQQFAGVLGTIEDSPKEQDDEGENFAGADKFVSTFELFHRMEDDHNEQIDAREYLKARLMDMFLGDWDRHADQWKWAGYKLGKRKWLWKPIPRDRDWAFTRFGGLVPSIAEQTVPELKGFSEDYPDIEGLTWKGRQLDHRILVSLDKPVWDSVTSFVVNQLTDSIIEGSVHRLPPEMYEQEGQFLESALKQRRSNMREASDELYHLCSSFPDIRGSNRPEVAQIDYFDDHRVKVALYARNETSGEKEGNPFYERVFSDDQTKDLRVYLLGGDDKAVVDGTGRSGINLRVIGGDGNDEFVDRSVHGAKFYDSDAGSKVSFAPRTSLDQSRQDEPQTDSARYESHFRDYGHRWKPAPWFGISPDYGLFIGWGSLLYDYGFRADPELLHMEFRGGMATRAVRFRFDYLGEFFHIVKGADLILHARATQFETINFFDFGNETPYNSGLFNDGYYRVHQQYFIVEPSIQFPLEGTVHVSFGGMFENIKSDVNDGTYLQRIKPYGSEESMKIASLTSEINIDTRDDGTASTRGYFLDVKGAFFPTMLDNDLRFGTMGWDARAYLTTTAVTEATLAVRVGGEKIWGDRVPFFEAAFLGGEASLRGYDQERFAGDASLYGSAELRIYLGRFSFLLPGKYGLSFFGDAGRVYVNGESSSLWHTSYGGGPWFSFILREFSLSTYIAQSHEKLGVYVIGGFAF